MTLILASTSRYRRELLARLRIPFEVRAPGVDEKASAGRYETPHQLAEGLAEEKATSLSAELPEATLIGGDQVVSHQGVVFSKPYNNEEAIRQLSMLSGGRHEVITAIAVWHRGHVWRHTDISKLQMRKLKEDEITRYVMLDQPLDCAGSYRLETLGICLFEQIISEDASAITGIPMLALSGILRKIGYAIP